MFIPTWIIMVLFLTALICARLMLRMTTPDLSVADLPRRRLSIRSLARPAVRGLNGRHAPLISDAAAALPLGMLMPIGAGWSLSRRQGFRQGV